MVLPSTDIALSQDRKRCNTQSGKITFPRVGKITFPRVGKNEETQVWYLFGKPIVGFLAWESIDSHIISQGWVGESFPCGWGKAPHQDCSLWVDIVSHQTEEVESGGGEASDCSLKVGSTVYHCGLRCSNRRSSARCPHRGYKGLLLHWMDRWKLFQVKEVCAFRNNHWRLHSNWNCVCVC